MLGSVSLLLLRHQSHGHRANPPAGDNAATTATTPSASSTTSRAAAPCAAGANIDHMGENVALTAAARAHAVDEKLNESHDGD